MSVHTRSTAARLGVTDMIHVVPNERTGRAVDQMLHDRFFVDKPLVVHPRISDLPVSKRFVTSHIFAQPPFST